MTFKRRLTTAGLLACLALSVLSVTKYYSVPLISYVVEEALVQKLPAGTDPVPVRSRFRTLISALPDRRARMEKLLVLSQFLEKLQTVDSQDLERLLARSAVDARRDRN